MDSDGQKEINADKGEWFLLTHHFAAFILFFICVHLRQEVCRYEAPKPFGPRVAPTLT